MLDVLSPCVTFNDHEGSTKSLKYIREHRDALNEVGFIPDFQPIEAEYDEGTDYRLRMHDGGVVTLHKLKDHNPADRMEAIRLLEQARSESKFLTGLIYIDEEKPGFAEQENLTETPLSFLKEEDLRPSKDALDEINASLMRLGSKD